MSINPADYIPHGMIAALGGLVTWIYRQHIKEDADRFEKVDQDLADVGVKLDTHFIAISKQLTDIALTVGKNRADI